MASANIGLSIASQVAQLGLPALIKTKKIGLYNILIPAQPPLADTLPDIIAMVTIEENHRDDMVITEHPIEQGASITDHSYKMPAQLVLHLGWSNSPNDSGSNLLSIGENLLATFGGGIGQTLTGVAGVVQAGYNLLTAKDGMPDIYSSLIELQEKRAIFDVYTTKRTYRNMMAKSISTETTNSTYNSMLVRMECQEVILVNTEITSITKDQLATGYEANADPINKGTQSLQTPSNTPVLP